MNKKQQFYLWIIIATASLVLVIVWLVLGINNHNILMEWIAIIALLFALVIFILSSYFAISNFIKSRELVKKSFSSYIDEIITNNNFGIIVYDNNDERITWASTFIKNRFDRNVIGLSLKDFFIKYYNKSKEFPRLNTFNISHNNFEYEVKVWSLKNIISIKDITNEVSIVREFRDQKVVLGEIEIDNYQLYQSILSEEQLFNINKSIVDNFEKYVKNPEYNFIYRQYTNGKFVIICNEKTLDLLEKESFTNFLTFKNFSEIGVSERISVSVGFAKGWPSLDMKIEQAKKALLQSKNRGGDQVTIFSNISTPVYYGSSSEILPDNSRTNIKLISNKLEQKLKSKNIKNVIIYGHKFADLDAIGSAYGVYKLAKNFGKDAYICNTTFDSTALKVIKKHNLKDEGVFIKPSEANSLTNSSTIVILVDNSVLNRTDNPNAIVNAKIDNIFIFDHHRVGPSVDFCLRENRYIDPNASSASEIVSEIIMFTQENNAIDALTAQLLLNGIYLDTAQFTKSITPRAFSAASYLESLGAKGTISNEILKIDEKTYKIVSELLENIQEVKPGYYLAYKDIEVSNDIISIASNEILKISGRVASFVVAKQENTNLYKLSARGINTNVQIICEDVGGGGHFGTAAAVTDEPLDVFIDNIIQAIVGGKTNESDIN